VFLIISDWDPFAEDIGIESDCDTEEEIRRFVFCSCHFYFLLPLFVADLKFNYICICGMAAQSVRHWIRDQ